MSVSWISNRIPLFKGSQAGEWLNSPPPLFVIGSGRSGNTLMRRVLTASEQIYIPPETFVLGDIIKVWPRTRTLRWRQRVWLFCAYFEKHYHFPTFNLPNLNEFAAEAAEMPRAQRNLRNLIENFYRYLARINGSKSRRWGEKSPWNTFHLPAIGKAFPEAKYLWLVRDGRDAALSYFEAGLYPDFASAAERWTVANEACAAFAKQGPDVMRVHYEDLVSMPEEEFGRVFAWAGLEFEPRMLNAQVGPMGDVEALKHHVNLDKPISARSVGRWRDKLTSDELAALSDPFWKLIEDLGYDRS